MSHKIQTITYSLAVFLSAYLLFGVQPMVGKTLLPGLGGTPSVWNTTMVFFQILLLLGYFYAHFLAKIKDIRPQFGLHIAFLLLAGLTLPMTTAFMAPSDGQSPLLWQLTTMAGMIAGPFLFLSATAPLLQKWFSFTPHPNASNPYFLYAASNAGSVLALILYPLAIEYFFPLAEQSSLWRYGYFILMVLIAACGLFSLKSQRIVVTADPSSDTTTVSFRDIALWLLLAFVPSSMMLGLTSYVTADIGSAPLFWVGPLTIYITSFIFAFAKNQPIPLVMTRILFCFLLPLIFCLANLIPVLNWGKAGALALFLFITCLMCHQELARLKPTVKHLTLFFLVMSCGGALGGIFNALIAPYIFAKPYEFMIAIILSVFCWNMHQKLDLNYASLPGKKLAAIGVVLLIGIFLIWMSFQAAPSVQLKYIRFAGAIIGAILVVGLFENRAAYTTAAVIMLVSFPLIPYQLTKENIYLSRNYFGTLSVMEKNGLRELSHGTTIHGMQKMTAEAEKIPLTYYAPQTANGQIFKLVTGIKPDASIGGLGLGTGSIACLTGPENHIDFYEIDPAVIDISQDKKIFTYLSVCNTPYQIILGDARLKLQNAANASYDMIFVDVFSSDNIPMHLITRQAAALYQSKIKPDGLIGFHISNRFFNLKEELAAIAKAVNMQAFYKLTPSNDVPGHKDLSYAATQGVALTNNPAYIAKLQDEKWEALSAPEDLQPWTDDFANPLRAMKIGRFNQPTATDERKAPPTSSP